MKHEYIYKPGDCFFIKPEALAIYGHNLDGIVFTIKSILGDTIIAHEKALKTAVAEFEIAPHPGPATPEASTPRTRRKPRTHDYRTPAQKCQAEIYAAIRAHKLPKEDAIQVLVESAEAIKTQLFKQEIL